MSNSTSALGVAPMEEMSPEETRVLLEDMKIFLEGGYFPRFLMEHGVRTGQMPVFWWTYLYSIL